MKIGIICSTGGHLTQALAVSEAFKGHDSFLVIQNFPNVRTFNPSEFRKTYHLRLFPGYGLRMKIPSLGYLCYGVCPTLLMSFFSLIRIFLKEKPDVLFSTGSEIAVVAFYVGRFLFGTKLIFLDSITRIKELSLTGKMLIPVADLFLVQWEDLTKKHKKAKFLGKII